MLKYIVLLGATVQSIGLFLYIRETIRGNSKPDRMTWLIWSIAPLIGTAAAFSDGVRWAVLPIFMAGFGPLLVFISSFFGSKGYWKLHAIDYYCGASSLLALVLWGITKEPYIAIIFAIIADAIAAIPTVIKSWKYPETETMDPYVTGLFNALTSFFAVQMWSFSEVAFPSYLVLLTSLIIFSLYKGRIRKRNE